MKYAKNTPIVMSLEIMFSINVLRLFPGLHNIHAR